MSDLVIGIVMVKDEADVIEDLVHHAFSEGMDAVVVSDNQSTDGTDKIVRRLMSTYEELGLKYDPERAYFQSEKMTKLAADAVEYFGADRGDWIVPMDADELWYHPDVPLAEHLRGLSPEVRGLHCSMWNHYVTDWDDDVGQSPFMRMVHRGVEQNPLHKVCYRWSPELVIEQGNHSVRGLHTEWTGAAIRHFPYRSPEQFVKKAANGKAAYDAGGSLLPPEMGDHWRSYGTILEEHGEQAAMMWFTRWFTYGAEGLDPEGVTWDPAPLRRWESLLGDGSIK